MARRATALTAEAIGRKLRDYKQSGLSRRGYCEREGIPLTTLDYYQRRLRELRAREAVKRPRTRLGGGPGVDLAEVALSDGRTTPKQARGGDGNGSFTVVLSNGRRLEMPGWGGGEADLARLIRVVERA